MPAQMKNRYLLANQRGLYMYENIKIFKFKRVTCTIQFSNNIVTHSKFVSHCTY